MNDIHNMDLNQLRLFLRIFESGSVTDAAVRLGVTQSAVSHSLRKLRHTIGDPLFVRSGHRLQPTKRAESMFPGVFEAFALLDASLTTAAPFDPLTCDQRFHLAMTDYVEALLLPRINRDLAAAAPALKLKISEIGNRPMQKHGQIWDLMIARLGPELPSDFYTQKLWRENFVTICSKHHPHIQGDSLTLDSFLAEKHILVGTETAGPGAVDRALAALDRQRSIKIVTGFFLSPARVVATSDLVATIPRRLAEQAITELPIKILPVPLKLDAFDITMAWNAQRHWDPAHRWFRSWVKSLFTKDF